MKRSTINFQIRAAIDLFDAHRFPLPPFAYWSPAAWRETGSEADEIRRCRLGWDLTDFGRGDFERCGLLLFTMRNGRAADAADTGTSPSTTLGPVKPYAEKVMVVGDEQVTPWHYHVVKMEDIINRGGGRLVIELCQADADGQLTEDGGVAPFAVEIQRRLGSRLRNHLRRIPETELGVARTKRHDELRHTSVALEPPKPFGGFQHASGDPPEDHRAPAPALHVVLHVPGAAEETLDRIRRGQRSLEARGEP